MHGTRRSTKVSYAAHPEVQMAKVTGIGGVFFKAEDPQALSD
jgi:hypothetical protein